MESKTVVFKAFFTVPAWAAGMTRQGIHTGSAWLRFYGVVPNDVRRSTNLLPSQKMAGQQKMPERKEAVLIPGGKLQYEGGIAHCT